MVFANQLAISQEIDYYEHTFDNESFNSSIRTVRLYKLNWEQGDPVIALGSGEQLEMHWDVLNEEITNFQYKIVHCTKDWQMSDLNEMEYLDGFNDNYVEYYENSFNTFQPFTHYAIAFPNDEIDFLKSGNYAIIVYPEGYEDEPVITRRFYVTEAGFTLEPDIRYPSDVEERYYRQEVDFNIYINPQEITNPYDNVHVYLQQNHREDNMCTGVEPNFVKENQLVYNFEGCNVFEGGNEFRHLDLTTHLSKTAHVREYKLKGDTIHALLLNDMRRQFKQYVQYNDINGRYIIKTLNGSDYNLESQYVMTHFYLPYEKPLGTGEIYIYGELSDWRIKEEFKMYYNAESKTYYANVLLKQGYYNYNYLFVPDYGKPDLETVEGTHFDTENEYVFKVYYSDPQNFYDRLMMYEVVKSRDN
jgi:hypothetical protein